MERNESAPFSAWYYRVATLILCSLLGATVGCQPSDTGQSTPAPPADDSASSSTSPAPAVPGPSAPPESSSAVQPQSSSPASVPREPAGPQPGQPAAGETEPSQPVEPAPQPSQPPPGDQTRAPAVLDRAGWQPAVAMSQTHAETCLVKMGDKMPAIELPDLSGTPRRLEDLLGRSLTVVVFWNSQLAFAREQYQRLAEEIAQPYGRLGVTVVAINVGDAPDVVRPLASDRDGDIKNLLDGDRSVYKQVATAKLPRTYLLDASGKILWMDIEYSRATRRELDNALRYYLKLEG